ncbi:MAG: flagellar filament capping protein FliD [Phycisphaeraceae bacterium]|nr:flagellar filament capping protein FliD [Phycisphaeraceae bacterium]
MGGISSSTGLFSGIDTASLIEQLLAIDARPKQLAQNRVAELQTQQTAFLDINSRLLALKSAAAKFNSNKVFDATRASSSNTDALTATASDNATLGSFNFTVSRLVSTHQLISRRFADDNTSGQGATEFTFEIGKGSLTSDTNLADLNGGEGIKRGKIKITDSSGASAVIDLSRAVTVEDVLDAVNSSGDISVQASADGHGIKFTDAAGGAGAFTIAEVANGTTAETLGIKQSVAAGATIASGDILYLSENTSLSVINDGAGVSFGPGGAAATPDFALVYNDGSGDVTYNINLGEIGETVDGDYSVTGTPVVTIKDLKNRIETLSDGNLTVSITPDGRGLSIDAVDGTSDVTITPPSSGRTTHQQLGFTDNQTGAGSIASTRLLAGVNSVLAANLNGGSGVGDGTIDFTTNDLTSFSVNVSATDSVAEILDKINTAGAGAVTASINSSGNGVRIIDNTGGAGGLTIADSVGTAAANLGIEAAANADGDIDSGNLQFRYISRGTLLSSLNNGAGIGTGSFRITDADGASATVNIDDDLRTIGDLISRINSRPINVTARVNDNGDGIILEDSSASASPQALKVEEISGGVAKKLNLLKTADFSSGDPVSDNVIDGSFERSVAFEATDTLRQIADKINAAGVGVDATIINDGVGASPYRLILTSETTGSVGRLLIDTKGFDLGATTLSQAQDAVVFFGSDDPADAVLITSSSNTLDSVVNGLTLDLNNTTDEPVEVTVSRNVTSIEESLSGFVDAVNAVFDRLDFHERYDADTGDKGALFGDSTVSNLRRTILRTVSGKPLGTTGQFEYLFQIGISVGSGGQLEFDKDRFRDAYEQDPAAVEDLVAAFQLGDREPTEVIPGSGITTPATEDVYLRQGIAELVETLIDDLTNSVDGTLTRKNQTYDNQIKLQNDRIVQFDRILDNKRTRLQQQFLAMEQALASLNSQQQALGSLTARLG